MNLSKVAYQAYCEQAGGVTFDGKPLPTYEELGTNRPLTQEEVALLMIHVKASRLASSPIHADSRVDIAGYVNCVSNIQQGE